MSETPLRPSSIEGVKRLAKQLKSQQGVDHHLALDAAARQAGFQNFKHAQNALANRAPELNTLPDTAGYPLHISAAWRDPSSGSGGIEILQVDLSTPQQALLTAGDLAKHRALAAFRSRAPDHLERVGVSRGQASARESVCEVARVLQFMDATRLRPSQAYLKVHPRGSYQHALPGQDHSSVWYDPIAKRYLYVDEPYSSAAEQRAAERAAWAVNFGREIARTKWQGMYYPGHTVMYLITDPIKGVPLQPILSKLDSLPSPVTAANWSGKSAPRLPPFTSPGARRKIEALGTKVKSAKKAARGSTVSYMMALVGSQRRPNARMPLDAHKEIGAALKVVMAACYHRAGVYNPLNSVRSELDEWVQREYPSEAEMPQAIFLDLYYSDLNPSRDRNLDAGGKLMQQRNLDKVKELLIKHYPECAPLRSLLRKVQRAEGSLKSW